MSGVFPWGLPPARSQYGALPPRSSWTVPTGYASLVGPNNAGKSTLLQYAFVTAVEDSNFGARRVAYIPADRFSVQPTTQVGGRTLVEWNTDMLASVRTSPMHFGGSSAGPPRSELYALLLQTDDYLSQLQRLDTFLPRLGFESMRLRGAQTAHFGDMQAIQQGAGLRSVLPVLAALTDPELRLILIDEPELSLEPMVQRRLRDLLVESATEERPIVVATQSHLMLNRSSLQSVLRVDRALDGVHVTPTSSVAELLDVVFGLLGNSTEDLFFPGNFLIVEGASDAAICNAVLTLHGVPPGRVKVLAAGGVDSVRQTAAAVERALVPLTVNDSPYATRVVAMVDAVEPGRLGELRRVLGERLIVLDAASLEEYIPDGFYSRVGLDKVTVLAQLQAAARRDQSALKAEVAVAMAAVLTSEDLPAIPLIVKAVTKAIEGADQAI
jgi:ABC-type cobalamin transport system ATPase subunit